MDSVTQAALGAAVGEAVLGKRAGRKAAAWGAALGTLPDLDVFIPMGHAVNSFTWHRGPSHSIFVLGLLTPFAALLLRRLHRNTGVSWNAWAGMTLLVFATHILLDAFTVYGTQLFWPVTDFPVGLGSIFIIDPLYTLPLLAGLIATLLLRNTRARAVRFNRAALLISTLYLAWSATAQQWVRKGITSTLAEQGIEYTQLLVTPTPFNTLAWRGVAMDGDHYREIYTSLPNPGRLHSMKQHPRLALDAEELAHLPVFQRLAWFSKGFYALEEADGVVIMTDLCMGSEPNYVFRFTVARKTPDGYEGILPRHLRASIDLDTLKQMWNRLAVHSEPPDRAHP